MFEAEVAALERAQAITGQAVLAGLQLDRQRQVFETQARWHMVEDLYLQRLRKVVFDRQLHLAPSTQRQAAGYLAFQVGRRQALHAHRIQQCQGQQRQEQPPVDRHEIRRNRDLQCHQSARHNGAGQQDQQPDEHQARGFHRRGAGTWSSNCWST
ncbi:hypothetical protein D3C85_840190 [compost metagenome]